MTDSPVASGHMDISDLVRISGLVERGVLTRVVGGGCEILDVTHTSQEVTRGSLFCCVMGGKHDGHEYAEQAILAGASALLVQRELTVSVPQVVVTDVRVAMGLMSAALRNFPSRQMMVIGVTGTNGKTTTAQLLGNVLSEHGLNTRVLGTLSGERTTMESTDLQRMLARFVDEGVQAVVMEVTSHAMVLQRVVGTSFAAAVFTNLSQDHLDFHHTMEQYFAAKASLFTSEFTHHGVVNGDDVYGQLLIDSATVAMYPYSEDDVRDVVVTPRHHSFTIDGHQCVVPLGGRFNLHNSLAVIASAQLLGVPLSTIIRGLAATSAVPGRFEAVSVGQSFDVIVDYAHTPDALERVLRTLRESVGNSAKIIVVFGCGGDRDQHKRRLMGQVAGSLADGVVITSDNPRSESATAIAAEINAGVDSSDSHKVIGVELDRRTAIAKAFDAAKTGDVVVIAGKGHERTQTIGVENFPFSDVAVARELLGAHS
jgi:UDP-N-acetylmuramoyl-L-alanyl-D-glutamate--2,6-diaminopimelate ligase